MELWTQRPPGFREVLKEKVSGEQETSPPEGLTLLQLNLMLLGVKENTKEMCLELSNNLLY